MSIGKTEYSLNFVIPSGATGPTGPTGPQGNKGLDGPVGLIGPHNVSESLAFAEYFTTDQAGILTINSAITLPHDNNIFRSSSTSIYSDINGQYEYIISGCLKESAPHYGANLLLRIKVQDQNRSKDIITISLPNETPQIFFSTSVIAKSMYTLETFLIFNKNVNSDATIKNVNLIIKRLPFNYNA